MNKKQILEEIYSKFRQKTGLGIVVGVEQEFYISGKCSVVSDQEEKNPDDWKQMPEVVELNKFLSKFQFFSELEKERGENQFEVQIYPTDNPAVMADMVELLRDLIRGSLSVVGGFPLPQTTDNEPRTIFSAKPFPERPGSALHININLTDSSGRNLFMKNGDEESPEFNQSIAGLLELMPASLRYFAPYPEAYVRYTNHGMESPSTISWGPDNRTVSLRVPSVPIAVETRHIEHRLPCADADPYLVMAAIIAGVEFGIVNKLENKHPKIWGNAFLPQYSLPKLPQSLEESETIKNEYLDKIMVGFC